MLPSTGKQLIQIPTLFHTDHYCQREDDRGSTIYTMDNNYRQTIHEKWWSIFFSIAIIGIVAVTISLADSRELPLTIIGAVLGVAMTVFATFFLFKGQSKQQIALLEEQQRIEREREYETEIFKQKLNTYQRFLDALCAYVKTKSAEAQSELKFRTASLAMHCDSDKLIKLNQQIYGIINIFEKDDVKMMEALFNISEIFAIELYPDHTAENSDEYLASIQNLANIIDKTGSVTDRSEIVAEDRANEEEDAKDAENVSSWEEKIAMLKEDGWCVDVNTVKDTISLTNIHASHRIDFLKKGKFYIVQVQSDNDDTSLAKALKKQFKGNQRSNTWSRELTSLPNYGVSNSLSTAIADKEKTKARAVIIKWIDRLKNI